MKVSVKNQNDTTWFVVALEEEFTSDKHNVLYMGVGKINASMATQWLLNKFKVQKIINIGTAGGNPNKVEKDKIYAIGKVVDRDWKTPDCINPEIIINNQFELETKTCYTGDSFVTDWDAGYEMVDMEAFAVAKVCSASENNVSFECYKYISDTGSDQDWQESLVKCNDVFNKMFK